MPLLEMAVARNDIAAKKDYSTLAGWTFFLLKMGELRS
jgi:hypothetical protein